MPVITGISFQIYSKPTSKCDHFEVGLPAGNQLFLFLFSIFKVDSRYTRLLHHFCFACLVVLSIFRYQASTIKRKLGLKIKSVKKPDITDLLW